MWREALFLYVVVFVGGGPVVAVPAVLVAELFDGSVAFGVAGADGHLHVAEVLCAERGC